MRDTPDTAREAQVASGNGGQFSPDVVELFANLLSQVQIPASAKDFDEQVSVVSKAKRELDVFHGR